MSYNYLPDISTIVASYGLILILAALLPAIIMGIFTSKLAGKKGYRGYFFTGFFFGLIGLIYVVGLPLAQDASGYVQRRNLD